ncbi:hypothetical protein [Actinoplanes sp. DH11]|uniref:hypothetical protein n=1 Tax=Actinoplanes sp. DH11 TaxID=2857011 RepID=UPI001E41A4C8|nr:hypothetical protein [Actinoplanes sp. DH11]
MRDAAWAAEPAWQGRRQADEAQGADDAAGPADGTAESWSEEAPWDEQEALSEAPHRTPASQARSRFWAIVLLAFAAVAAIVAAGALVFVLGQRAI